MQRNRLRGGIIIIEEAAEQINELRITVTEKNQIVKISSENCKAMMADIEFLRQKVKNKIFEASEKTIELELKGKQIAIEKVDTESALSDAIQALQQATHALANIDKSQITDIRSIACPPPQVQVVCECVAILKGLKEITWKSAKAMMLDVNFIRSLMEMNCELLTTRQINACRAHMKSAAGLDEMGKISQTGVALLSFVRASIEFYEVFREVKPKKERVEFLEQEQDFQTNILNNLNKELIELEKSLVKLNTQHTESTRQLNRLIDAMNQAKRRLVASDQLISGLNSEHIRWTKALQVYGQQETKLVGQCLICSSFLAYTAAFSWEFRRTMIYCDWLNDLRSRQIPISDEFDLIKCFCTEVQLSNWLSQGLPSDEFSIQNGILTVHASRFPLCIDPQKQALYWIKKNEAQNSLKVLSFSDPDFLERIESSIMYGIPVLFQDVDDYIDPVIYPILEKNIHVTAGRKFVMLGGREVDYDSHFRMYLTTNFTNPAFDSAIYARAMVINYTITTIGLEQQLLSIVIQFERPDLEVQREKLIAQTSENKNLLQQLEDSFLSKILSSTGNMLDNMELIKTLENAKTKANTIDRQLRLTTETVHSIEKLRVDYLPVAKTGAVLFFALSDMAMVNSMYQYALYAFLHVFVNSIKKSNTDSISSNRVFNIIKVIIENVYSFGCLGIFEKHKLLFSFQLATKLEQNKQLLTQCELNFLIKGSISVNKNEKECPATWISVQNWTNIKTLSNEFPESFKDLDVHIERHLDDWKKLKLKKSKDKLKMHPPLSSGKSSDRRKKHLFALY